MSYNYGGYGNYGWSPVPSAFGGLGQVFQNVAQSAYQWLPMVAGLMRLQEQAGRESLQAALQAPDPEVRQKAIEGYMGRFGKSPFALQWPKISVPGQVTTPGQPAVPAVPGVPPAPQDINAPEGGLTAPTGEKAAIPAVPEVRAPATEQYYVPPVMLESQTFNQVFAKQPQILAALRDAGYPVNQPISDVNQTFGTGWRAIAYYGATGAGDQTTAGPSAAPSVVGPQQAATSAGTTATPATPRPGTIGSVAPWLSTSGDPQLQEIGNMRIPPAMLDANGFADPAKVDAWLKAQPAVTQWQRAHEPMTPYEKGRIEQQKSGREITEHREYLTNVKQNIDRLVTAAHGVLNREYPDATDARAAQQQAHGLFQRARDFVTKEVQDGRMTQEEGNAILGTLPTSFVPPVRRAPVPAAGAIPHNVQVAITALQRQIDATTPGPQRDTLIKRLQGIYDQYHVPATAGVGKPEPIPSLGPGSKAPTKNALDVYTAWSTSPKDQKSGRRNPVPKDVWGALTPVEQTWLTNQGVFGAP